MWGSVNRGKKKVITGRPSQKVAICADACKKTRRSLDEDGGGPLC